MRIITTVALIVGLGVVDAAMAQPAAPQEKAPAPPAAAQPKSSNEQADAALAMSIRMQREQDERIARIACAAGDKDKCAQLANASTTPRTPSPERASLPSPTPPIRASAAREPGREPAISASVRSWKMT